MTSPPPDVLLARAIHDLTRALLIGCAAVGVLGLAGVAILTLAPHDLTGLLPALTLLGLCQVFALVGSVVVGVGLRAALGPRRTDAGPADADPVDAARAAEASAVVARRLHLVARVVLAACVLAVAAWALADGAAAVGALLGALVGAQVAVVFVLLARWLVRT